MKELKLLPESWARVSLAEVVAVNPKHKDLVDQVAGFVPMKLAPKDFNGTLHYEERQWDKIKKGYTHFATGDVIFAKVTPCFENGKAAIVKNIPNGIGAGSTEFYVLRPANNDISVDYIFSVIKSHEFLHSGAENMTGAVGLRRVPKKFVEDFKINLPPPAEQQEIVAQLDKLLAQVESTKTRLDAIPVILKRFRQSVLAAATSGELTKEWRIKNKNVLFSATEIKKEHENFYITKGKKYKIPESISNSINPFEIPISWGWLRAEQFCDLITKGTTPKKDKMGNAFKIPYIKVYNLTFDGTLDFTINPTFIDQSVHKKELARSIVFPGDVLMNIVGPPLGKVSIVPNTYPEWNMNQAISVFRPVCAVDNKYLSFCLQSNGLLDLVKMRAKATAGQFNLTLEICRDYPIPTPHISEQKEIVRRVEELYDYADKVEAQVNAAQERVNNLTQSLLAKAFSGELTAQWRAQNPELITGENSAAALLEKIKAERAALTAKKKPVKKTTARKAKA